MQQLGDPEAVPLQRAVPALASAGAAFNSPALQAAATVLQRTPTAGALAVELVRCAELEAPRRGERRAHCWRASDDPRSRSWDDLVADTAGGRCVPLAAAGSGAGGGDTATTTRAAARLYDDPVISLTVTIFEERYRGALPEVPHPAVIGLLRERWRDDEEGTGA